jgi:predicted signal transduction protein with EAL and GGDEF domain
VLAADAELEFWPDLAAALGGRLESAVAGKGCTARLGGDEFAVVLSRCAEPLDAANVANSIIEAIRTPFIWEGEKIQVGVSIGIAMSPTHGNSANELLANADLALYDAKSKPRGGYSFFQETFRQSVLLRLACESDLKRAFAEGELELYYHPQVTLADRRIVGSEALLRWNHPHQGLLAPGAFIHVLERSTLAAKVGNWAIGTACSFASSIRTQGHDTFSVTVNIFGAQFRSAELPSIVKSALQENQLPPQCLELEITENTILQQDEAVVTILHEIAQMGVRLSFDDYGTGYASLSLLKRFPLTRLKIDQGFVRNVCTDPEDTAVIKAIIYLAESFGLNVVAEGIENEDQERKLREFGCQYGQGYLYAKPMRAAALRAVLHNAEIRSRSSTGGS